jgi:hypothetical protein
VTGNARQGSRYDNALPLDEKIDTSLPETGIDDSPQFLGVAHCHACTQYEYQQGCS